MLTPAALNFTAAGLGTSFTSLSPLLQQTFFIGDALTGHATGASRIFSVPTAARTLYLGLTDACGYSGSPSCFGDNSGSFSVTTSGSSPVAAVPEPQSWALLAAGLGAVVIGARRRTAGSSAC